MAIGRKRTLKNINQHAQWSFWPENIPTNIKVVISFIPARIKG
jgi:hypothetical protein